MSDHNPSSEKYQRLHSHVEAARTLRDIERLDGWVELLADEALRRSQEMLGMSTRGLRGSSRDEQSPFRDPK